MKFGQKKSALTFLVISFFMAIVSVSHAGETFKDEDALKGVKSGKAFFDINLGSAEKMPLYLDVIRKTHEGLSSQNIQPDFVVGFRGASVQFVVKNRSGLEKKQAELLDQIASRIKDLKALGVRFEVCSIATGLFKIDSSDIPNEIKVVGNTFISLIGYQAQGYGVVTIM